MMNSEWTKVSIHAYVHHKANLTETGETFCERVGADKRPNSRVGNTGLSESGIPRPA